MIKYFSIVVVCLCLMSICNAESVSDLERSVKDADSKVSELYASNLKNTVDMGRKDIAKMLEENQKAWITYRDSEIMLEMGDIQRYNKNWREFYLPIVLRLTTERIQALEKAFEKIPICLPADTTQ